MRFLYMGLLQEIWTPLPLFRIPDKIQNLARDVHSEPHNSGWRMENLTPRELELARLVAEGYSNRQIADRLRLSRQTVKNHIQAAYRKLEVTNRVELTLRLGGRSVEELRRRFAVGSEGVASKSSTRA